MPRVRGARHNHQVLWRGTVYIHHWLWSLPRPGCDRKLYTVQRDWTYTGRGWWKYPCTRLGYWMPGLPGCRRNRQLHSVWWNGHSNGGYRWNPDAHRRHWVPRMWWIWISKFITGLEPDTLPMMVKRWLNNYRSGILLLSLSNALLITQTATTRHRKL